MPEFRVTRIVDRPRDLVFAVIADVERYSEFVPGFSDAQSRRTGEGTLEVMQRVGFKSLTVSFRSIARLEPPERIRIHSHDWPFRQLSQEWLLDEIGDGTTRVVLSTRYALASRGLERWFGRWFEKLLDRTVAAFEQRLRDGYNGNPR